MDTRELMRHSKRTRRYLYGLVATNATIVALVVAFFGYHQWVQDRIFEKVVQYHTVSTRAAQTGLAEVHFITDDLLQLDRRRAGFARHLGQQANRTIELKSLSDHILNLANERDVIASVQQRFADPEFEALASATIGAFDEVLDIGSHGGPDLDNLLSHADFMNTLALRLRQLARLHMAARDRLADVEHLDGLNDPLNLLTVVGVLTAFGLLVGAGVARGVTATNAERESAMRTLRESETGLARLAARLETAQRIGRIGNWEWDAATDTEWWSDENYRIIGSEPGGVPPGREILNRTVHPEDLERVLRIMDESETNRSGYQVDYRVVRPDGREVYAREIAEPVTDSRGNFLGQRGTFQDITLQREIEAGLAQTLRRLNDSQAIARIGNWECDIVNGTEWWSDQQFRNYGLEPSSDPVGANRFIDFVHPEDKDRALQARCDAVAAARVLDIEFRTIGADGVERVLWSYGRPEFDERGQPVRIVGTTLDITDRKKAEAAMRESESRLDAFFAVAPAGLALFDNKGRYIRINETLAATHGLRVEAHLGKKPTEILPETFGRLIEEGNRTVMERRTPMMNVEITAPLPGVSGGVIHCVHSRFPIFDSSGEVSGIGVVSVNVSELKKAQEELARLNAELEARVEDRTAALRAAQDELLQQERLATLGQLTATVSHELRNPLGAIRTSLYVIDRCASQFDERIAKAVDRVNRSVTRCDHIIDELLDFTRIRELRFEPLDLDAWLGSILDEQEQPEGIRVFRDFGAGGPVVLGDADRLRRAVINIYENACQAMSADRTTGGVPPDTEGDLYISTRLTDNHAEIIFRDNGPGIDPDLLERIFEPLFSTKNFGVGLGLPTVRHIMEQHGGSVDARNAQHGGAEFTLWLPVRPDSKKSATHPA